MNRPCILHHTVRRRHCHRGVVVASFRTEQQQHPFSSSRRRPPVWNLARPPMQWPILQSNRACGSGVRQQRMRMMSHTHNNNETTPTNQSAPNDNNNSSSSNGGRNDSGNATGIPFSSSTIVPHSRHSASSPLVVGKRTTMMDRLRFSLLYSRALGQLIWVDVWPLADHAQRRDRMLQLAASSSSAAVVAPDPARDEPPGIGPEHPHPQEQNECQQQQQPVPPSRHQVARDLLQWEKEINLMRYYGLAGYWQRHQEKHWPLGVWHRMPSLLTFPAWRFSSSSSSSSASASSGFHGVDPIPATKSSDDDTVAPNAVGETAASFNPPPIPLSTSTVTAPPRPMVGKIAFMITASMKTEMMNRLRYTPTELKSMTPLQASLVLLHSVTPEQRSEALPRLEQEHREEQQRLQQEQRDQIELLARQQQQQQEQETSILDAQMSSTTDDLTEADDIRTANSESTVGTLWYQVLEHQQQHSATMHQEKDESSEETVVAMYLHEKEAELGCETWQDLANQRFQRTSGPDNINRERSTGVVTYSIRKVYKE